MYVLFFFIISCKNPFNFFYNFTKIKIKSPSQQPTVLFPIYQNITWTIRRLVDETIDPVTLRIILKIVGFLNQLKLRKSQLELSEKWFLKSLTIERQTQLNNTNYVQENRRNFEIPLLNSLVWSQFVSLLKCIKS